MNKKAKVNPFEENLNNFIDNIDSLKNSLDLTMGLTAVTQKTNYSKMSDFIDKKAQKKTSKSFILKREDIHHYKKIKKDIDITKASFKVIPASSLISLVSQFDAFIYKTIQIILHLKPEILNSSEKSLNFSSLAKLKSIKEAKNYMIEKEIESVLRNNHKEHFVWLEKKLDIQTLRSFSSWKDFIEITERRNLFAHCGGKISSQYITNCKEHGIIIDKKYKIGDKLEISADYLKSSYECLFEVGTKLTHVIWRKLKPKEIDLADTNLNNDICYKLIEKENYQLADVLLEFATEKSMKRSNVNTKNLFIINKALSKKLNNQEKIAAQILNDIDWRNSETANDFNLAKETILGNNKKALSLMEKIGKESKYIDKTAYRTAPLFSKLRKSKKFKEIFKKIYKEDYNLKEDTLDYDFKLTVKPKKTSTKRISSKKK